MNRVGDHRPDAGTDFENGQRLAVGRTLGERVSESRDESAVECAVVDCAFCPEIPLEVVCHTATSLFETVSCSNCRTRSAVVAQSGCWS